MGVTISPFALVDRTVSELTDPRAMSDVILPVALEHISIRQDHLALAVFQSLGDTAIVYLVHNLTQLIIGVIKEVMPVRWHLFRKLINDLKLRFLHSDLEASLSLLLSNVLVDLE